MICIIFNLFKMALNLIYTFSDIYILPLLYVRSFLLIRCKYFLK